MIFQKKHLGMAEAWFHGILRRCGNDFEKRTSWDGRSLVLLLLCRLSRASHFAHCPPFPAEQPPGSPRIREEEKTINFPPRDQDFWDITRTDDWCWELVYFWGGIIHSRVSALSWRLRSSHTEQVACSVCDFLILKHLLISQKSWCHSQINMEVWKKS